MAQPIIKSRRQHIRLWFEFYKLALDDPSLQANLAKVRTFYEPWGDPRGVDFDVWWKDRAYLSGTAVMYPFETAYLNTGRMQVRSRRSVPLEGLVRL